MRRRSHDSLSSQPPTKRIREGHPMAEEKEATKYDFDLAVIGGGSGGMAAAKAAAECGAKVVCFDFVKPTPKGTKWDLGGTCVNVGCIPKKAMHYAAHMAGAMKDAKQLGWPVEEVKHSWETMVEAVDNYIRGLNWGNRVALQEAEVEYLHSWAAFVDPHTLTYTAEWTKEVKQLTAKYILVAGGGRPLYPDIPGAKEHGITSDDIFWWKTPPGKTLVVGASYIALECAGFLHELGFDVTVAVRSIFLRGFDQQMAEIIGGQMADTGVKFLRPCVLTKLEKKNEEGRISVTLKNTAEDKLSVEEFDTVLFAIGRKPQLDGLQIRKAGVKLHERSGKILATQEVTNVPHIFALGDIIHGRPELTPVAIQAGQLLMKRLFAGATRQMDYTNVPTTVFTPLEYGACGLSSEAADAKFGKENVEVDPVVVVCPTEKGVQVWLSQYGIVEFTVGGRHDKQGAALQPCVAKLVCDLTHDRERGGRVVGFHYIGPNAGEITQGFGMAVKLGATKEDFDELVGIHPTAAEEFTLLSLGRKREAAEAKPAVIGQQA